MICRYDTNSSGQGQYYEQKAIDVRGGIGNLDKKINAASQSTMQKLNKEHGGG